MKRFSKLFFVLFLSLMVAGLTGCLEKGKSSGEAEKEKVEEKADADQTAAAANPQEQEKEIQEFVLKNTKVVKIFNVSKRINEKHPNLGPFFVVRGIDERGQKAELWIKDMKIFEMVNSN